MSGQRKLHFPTFRQLDESHHSPGACEALPLYQRSQFLYHWKEQTASMGISIPKRMLTPDSVRIRRPLHISESVLAPLISSYPAFAGHVWSTAFSPCSGPFQMLLTVLSFIFLIKTFPSPLNRLGLEGAWFLLISGFSFSAAVRVGWVDVHILFCSCALPFSMALNRCSKHRDFYLQLI